MTEAILAAIVRDHQALVTRMQIERESLYDDYDRMRSEAELRYSIAPPLALIAATAAVHWTWLAALAVIGPIILLVQATRMQARAEERVLQLLTTGVITSPTLDRLFSGSVSPN